MSIREQILKSLGMVTFLKPSVKHIDIGNKEINKVFGNKQGIPSGKLFELAGLEHAGKTLWCIILAILAQLQHKAFVVWIDLEGTWDDDWALKLGMDLSKYRFYLIRPTVVKWVKSDKGGSKKAKSRKAGNVFLQSIEWSYREAEAVMGWFKEKYPDRPIFLVTDSVANMQTEVQANAGATDQNMSTQQARAAFLSMYLPKMAQLASNYDGWFWFINQIRTNPAKAFGNPEYTPGGKALAHNAHSRIWLRKLKGGQLIVNGVVRGIKGKAVNIKNKVGGGSEAYLKYGFQIAWDKPLNEAMKFMDIKKAEKD